MRLSGYFRLTQTTFLLVSFTALPASAGDASVNSSTTACSDFDPTAPVVDTSINSSSTACSDFDSTVLASTNGNEDANFWERIADMGYSVQQYTSTMFNDITTSYAAEIDSFKQSVNHVISNTMKLRSEIESKIQERGITLHEVSEMLSKELAGVVEELQAEFPPDHAKDHEDRVKVISGALTKVEDAVVQVCAAIGVSEKDARAYFRDITPHLRDALVTIGDVAEQHPVFFETLMFWGATLLVPELWILKPIIAVFGIGPTGPIKGTSASWAQSRFFGQKVTTGSWFSVLQSMAMAGQQPPETGKKILGSLGLDFGLFERLVGEIRG